MSPIAPESSVKASDQTKPRASCILCHQVYVFGVCVVITIVINHRISLIVIYFVINIRSQQ